MTYKDKLCPCGVKFTPTSGAQKFHSAECPARQQEPGPKPAPAVTTSEASSLLSDLRKRCEDEAARLDGEIARLTAQRENVQAAAAALA